MGKVLYTGLNLSGEKESGFVDAMSNKDALHILKKSGLQDVKLHSNVTTTQKNSDPDWLSEADRKHIAKLQVKWQKEINLSSFLGEVIKSNFVPIAAGAAMVYYGYSNGSASWMSAGTILASALPFFNLWNYRLLTAHDKLIKATTFGEWDKVEKLSEEIRRSTKERSVVIQADTLEANFYAKNDNIERAKDLLSVHEDYLEDTTPGLYENKLASLYYASKDYDLYLLNMKKAFKASGQDIMRVDMAMAEAKFGNLLVAEREIDKVYTEAMPAFGVPFVYYTRGIIEHKKKNLEEAKDELILAYSGFLEYSKNPATWVATALTAGSLSLVLHDLNEHEKAYELLKKSTVNVLKIHADEIMINNLKNKFPQLF